MGRQYRQLSFESCERKIELFWGVKLHERKGPARFIVNRLAKRFRG